MDIILLQRDLRLMDNPALFYGSKKRNYCVIYVYDKNYWESYGRSSRQLKFAIDCLSELDKNLKRINSKVFVHEGSFESLGVVIKREFSNFNIHLNHCTDNIYHREDIKKFIKSFNDKEIKIYDNFGLQLKEFNRDTWSRDWNKIMSKTLLEIPEISNFNKKIPLQEFKDFEKKNIIEKHELNEFQIGGEKLALELLNSFFEYRANGYRKKMSCPNEAETACSRLSPHIAFGSISLRKVYQALSDALITSNFKNDLYSFKKRLHWHCHFIQKLETEPELEYKSMHPHCDKLREIEDKELIEKWINGETGFPFLDACLIYLRKTGWINFRMRAMIMSFASYNLWQPWQLTSPLLAELFTDFEPGIHISQVQMQSGVTGINLPRIYSVYKQSFDQDPSAEWIKSIIPSLKKIDLDLIHNAELKDIYLEKIVDPKKTAAKARESVWSMRKNTEFKKLAKEVFIKHGSRRTQRFNRMR
ncbi:MAG: deoxyribodipyrimidine photo-lyase/cryptochrome family protein [Pseudomonadota bacterium]|nr:deoxyribodipyrimidine photo-lyase/cryptochrome family protein [Pseudomonadota bacterium]